MRPRTVEPTSSSMSSTTRTCENRGCENTTREGKPFCPSHVENHEYVRTILMALAEREAETVRVRENGPAAVNTSGLTAQELLLHLSLHGSRTVERLSREFQLESEVMFNYVTALRTEGSVVLGRTTRGSTVVRLAG